MGYVMTSIRTSVVLCTYNGVRYLREQLESIFRQTVIPDEIVIRDDASQDASLDVARDAVLAENFQGRTHFLKNTKNLGVTRNFEEALSYASGDIIFLSDQDDVWAVDKIERVLRLFAASPWALLVHTNADLIGPRGECLGRSLFDALQISKKEVAQLSSPLAFELLLRRTAVTGATCAIRRILLENARPFPMALLHDEWLGLCAASFDGLVCHDDRLTQYRIHEGNVVGVSGGVAALTGAAFHRARADRYAAIATALARYPSAPKRRVDAAAAAAVHSRARAECHEMAGIGSLRLILREVRRGAYVRYSRGLRSVVRDLGCAFGVRFK